MLSAHNMTFQTENMIQVRDSFHNKFAPLLSQHEVLTSANPSLFFRKITESF